MNFQRSGQIKMTGEPSLPHEVQVGRFLEAREAEIKALEGELVRTGKGKLASQQVTPQSPHSMRVCCVVMLIHYLFQFRYPNT